MSGLSLTDEVPIGAQAVAKGQIQTHATARARMPEGATITPVATPDQSGKPSFRRFFAIESRVVVEKTIACLNFETVKSG